MRTTYIKECLSPVKWTQDRSLGLGRGGGGGVNHIAPYNCSNTKQILPYLYRNIKSIFSWDPRDSVEHSDHGGIFNFDFSSDGSIMVAACERRSFLLFDPLNGKLIGHKNNAHNDCVNCIRFLDPRIFATCSDDTTINIWDVRYLRQKIRTLHGHSNWVKNIEYAEDVGLLVTSGFDGSIYTWDINKYSESPETTFTRVFHTNGLMRSKLTPDSRKLVISTAGGYLMVIHNLDLNTLSQDLHGFKPNMYRLMQMSQSPVRQGYMFNQVFERQKNRVELISDFPTGNEPEVIASLQVHPYGWSVLSRNTSSDEHSEWTSVHDIQEMPDSVKASFDDDDQDISSDSLASSVSLRLDEDSCSSASHSPSRNSSSSTSTASDDNHLADTDMHQVNNLQVSRRSGESPIWSITTREHSSPPIRIISGEESRRLSLLSSLQSSDESQLTMTDHSSLFAMQRRRHSAAPQLSRTRNFDPRSLPAISRHQQNQARGRLPSSPTFLIRSGSQVAERTLLLMSNNAVPGTQLPKIHTNNNRLTHFIEEANVGRGFIKEPCFSSDGRLICSPFAFGSRLLAFNTNCRELCDCQQKQAMKLTEIGTSYVSHTNAVLTTKFSPTHCMYVSGCLNGLIAFHQPVL